MKGGFTPFVIHTVRDELTFALWGKTLPQVIAASPFIGQCAGLALAKVQFMGEGLVLHGIPAPADPAEPSAIYCRVRVKFFGPLVMEPRIVLPSTSALSVLMTPLSAGPCPATLFPETA